MSNEGTDREAPEETQDEPAAPASAPPKKRKGRSKARKGRADGTRSAAQGPQADKPFSWVKALVVLGLVVIVGALVLWPPSRDAVSGKQAAPRRPVGEAGMADITLVTADRNDLDCVASKGVNKSQCGYSDEKTPRKIEERDRLRPYMTLDRQLYLIPGLFLEPAITKRFESEPPNKPRDQLKRFTAKCQLKVVGEVDNVKVRWSTTSAWEAPKSIPVATISGCSVSG